MQGRLSKLEAAISKQRTVKFPYWSISRDDERERTVNPLALFQDAGAWYVVGHDLEAEDERTFRVSRIRGEIRFATRRERDFRLPAEFDVDQYRGRPPWQIGDAAGEARIEVGGDTAWWVQRTYGGSGKVEDGVFVTEYSSLGLLASWVLRQDGRAIPREPEDLRREIARALKLARERHEKAPGRLAAESDGAEEVPIERPAAPVAPERFAVLQALLAYLLDQCGDEPEADLVATLSHGANERRLVEVDYLKEGEDEVSMHLVEPYALERRLPFWYVHTWDRTRDGERSFRLDRMRSARIQRAHFEPREGFDPHGFRDASPAKIWYSKQVARWEVEKGAHPLADGSAVAEKPVGSPEWLVGESLSFRCEAVVLDPPARRQAVSKRAQELQRELGVSRVRAAAKS